MAHSSSPIRSKSIRLAASSIRPRHRTRNQLFQRRANIANADYLHSELCGIFIPCGCLVPPLGVAHSGIGVDPYHRLGEVSLSHERDATLPACATADLSRHALDECALALDITARIELAVGCGRRGLLDETLVTSGKQAHVSVVPDVGRCLDLSELALAPSSREVGAEARLLQRSERVRNYKLAVGKPNLMAAVSHDLSGQPLRYTVR